MSSTRNSNQFVIVQVTFKRTVIVKIRTAEETALQLVHCSLFFPFTAMFVDNFSGAIKHSRELAVMHFDIVPNLTPDFRIEDFVYSLYRSYCVPWSRHERAYVLAKHDIQCFHWSRWLPLREHDVHSVLFCHDLRIHGERTKF